MTSDLTNHLPFPEDRFNGFVFLTDGLGRPYVADFFRSYDTGCGVGNALKYSRAFMVLQERYAKRASSDI